MFIASLVLIASWRLMTEASGANSFKYEAKLPETNARVQFRLNDEDSPFCLQQPCVDQQDCCDGAACVSGNNEEGGICARLVGQMEGKLCQVSNGESSCSAGMKCHRFGTESIGICVGYKRQLKKLPYFHTCKRTIDCDTSRSLCCRYQPPVAGRGEGKQICSYFPEALDECIF